MIPSEQGAVRRRFGIVDGMILVAGIAVGLAAIRASAPTLTAHGMWDAFFRPRQGWSVRYGFELLLELGSLIAVPFLAAISPACLIVQSRHPRSRWRRLSRQPGFVACLVAPAATGIALLVAVACWLGALGGPGDYPEQAHLVSILGGMVAGIGVLSSWSTMTLCGVWRPRPTWQDRLGRLVGAGWIVLGVVGASYLVLAAL